MHMMQPLLELPNRMRRPTKVYGRKRGLPETREIHRQLFGTDENDENCTEKSLALLTLSEKPVPICRSTALVQETALPSSGNRSSPPKIQLPQRSPSKTPLRNPAALTPQATKCSTLKRSRSKHSHVPSIILLTPSSQRQLQPLLSQHNVHPHVVSFSSFATRLLSKFDVSKSGEGSFSECLLLKHKTNPSDVAILKIIPFDLSSDSHASTAPPSDTDDSPITNSPISSVLREVQILSSLSPFHGFAQLRSCHVVRGPWHAGFLDAYHAFRTSHPELAVNPLPSERWDDDMVYGVIEMDDAGSDLESLAKPSAFQVFDAFWMSTVLLAVVEREVEFEHRDLHMSNICYRERAAGKGVDVQRGLVEGMREEPEVMLGLTNLKITIIDYTMSRLRMGGKEEVESGSEGEALVLFNPESAWSDNTDAHGNHQTITGQRMRRLALARSPPLPQPTPPHDHSPNRPPDPNKWSHHISQTNVLWLAHLLYQLLQQAGARPRHVVGSSAYAKKLQTRIWKNLREVLAYMDRDAPECGSTVELLSIAIDKGWIREEDVEGFKRTLNEEV